MRVAVASNGSKVSAHFGRCEEFVIAEVGEGSFQVVERLPNPGHDPSGRLPKLLKEKGVELVVTGGIGKRAKEWLSQFGISVIEGVTGDVSEALSLLSEGRLEGGEGLCDHSCKKEGARMKVAVTSTGPDLDSQVDPRFGRCAYFLIVDTDTMEFEAVKNPNVSAPSGAGIRAAQLVAERGAEVLITGAVGPNAMMALQQAGVQVVTGITSGTVREAVEAFKSGALQLGGMPAFGPGMGFGGFGPGMGWGGGMGRGRGRGGMGMGPGAGPGGPPFGPPQAGGSQQQAPPSQPGGGPWGWPWPPPAMMGPWAAMMFGPQMGAMGWPQQGMPFGPPPTDEQMRKQMAQWLRQQAEWLRQQLRQIETMLSELEDEEEDRG